MAFVEATGAMAPGGLNGFQGSDGQWRWVLFTSMVGENILRALMSSSEDSSLAAGVIGDAVVVEGASSKRMFLSGDQPAG